MKNSVIEQKIASLKEHHQLILELIGKLEDVASLETRVSNISSGSEPVAPEHRAVHPIAPKNVSFIRGAARSKAATKDSGAKPKTSGKPKSTGGSSKPVSLRSVVKHIVMSSKTPLSYPQVAEKAIASGYKTIAKDFGNNVYQSLNKLVRDKELRQHKENNVVLFEAA